MIQRRFTKLLLRPEDVPASRDDFEVIGTFNPGVVQHNGEVVLLIRVAERPKEKREGYTAIPRYDANEGLTVDWFKDDVLDKTDPRVVIWLPEDRTYLTFVSHIRIVRSKDGRSIDSVDGPCFAPEKAFEAYGVEDPRITPIDDRLYFTYVGVSEHGACTALASTTDFQTFERHGIIFSPENKDVLLFPERIRGEYWALHRPNPRTHFRAPEMWTARSKDLLNWGGNLPFYGGTLDWEGGRVGGGTPPFRTEQGWIEIYHGNRRPSGDSPVGAYSSGVMLLDPENPNRILRQSGEPILLPQEDFEREGFVSHVVFPTGIVHQDDSLLVYYGASDTYTAVTELSMKDLLSAFG